MSECIYCGGIVGQTCFDPQGHQESAFGRSLKERLNPEEREGCGDCDPCIGGKADKCAVGGTILRPRFEVTWDGYAESSFKVVDNNTAHVLKEFDCALLGANTARKAAARLVQVLNGDLHKCPECDSGEEMGRRCTHCNGEGFQIFKGLKTP